MREKGASLGNYARNLNLTYEQMLSAQTRICPRK